MAGAPLLSVKIILSYQIFFLFHLIFNLLLGLITKIRMTMVYYYYLLLLLLLIIIIIVIIVIIIIAIFALFWLKNSNYFNGRLQIKIPRGTAQYNVI